MTDHKSPAAHAPLANSTSRFKQPHSHGFAFPRRVSPGPCKFVAPVEIGGRRDGGRPTRPQAACAEIVAVSTRVVRSHRNHPAFPAQWFTAYNALSPATGLSCHCHPQEACFSG